MASSRNISTVSKQYDTILVGGSLSEVIRRGDKVIKRYRGVHKRGYEKLRKEVAYINALPQNVKDYYPEIINIVDSQREFGYAMPFYENMTSLSSQLFSSCDSDQIWNKLESVIGFMDSIHYPASSTSAGIDDYIKRSIHNRLAEAHDALDDIIGMQALTRGEIMVNNRHLFSLKDIRTRLRADHFTNVQLAPDELLLFHGNFHMDNILANHTDYMLIDPRGELYGSRLYDISKLFVHMLTRYDEIHLNKFELISFNATNIAIRLTDSVAGGKYDYIQRRCLEKYSSELGEDQFRKIIQIVGGVHAVSFASYHARKPSPCIERVQAYLGAGLLLLTSYLSDQEIDLSKSLFSYGTKEMR